MAILLNYDCLGCSYIRRNIVICLLWHVVMSQYRMLVSGLTSNRFVPLQTVEC